MEDSGEPAIDMCSAVLAGHSDAIYAVAVHPTNPDLIATASGDDTAGIWTRYLHGISKTPADDECKTGVAIIGSDATARLWLIVLVFLNS